MEAAITSYKQALLLRPDFPEATCNLLHTLQVRLSPHMFDMIAPASISWLLFFSHRLPCVYSSFLLLYQCVCCWEDRSKMFTEVEGIIRRQINVSVYPQNFLYFLMLLQSKEIAHILLCLQMSVLPSVQPFHAIAYPIDPILALEIRFEAQTQN